MQYLSVIKSMHQFISCMQYSRRPSLQVLLLYFRNGKIFLLHFTRILSRDNWHMLRDKFYLLQALCHTVRVRLHGAIYRPDSFVLMLRYCANLKAIRYKSTSLNRIAADKSHRVIVAAGLFLRINVKVNVFSVFRFS